MGAQQCSIDLTTTTTYPVANLGEYHIDTLGRWWQYVKGGATITQYNYVKISTDSLWTITAMSTTTNPSTEPAQVGCIQVAGGFTSSLYGWVFRGFGLHTGQFAASCVQDVKIYTTASGTAGVVDDSATTLVQGLKLITTITTAAASPAWANGLLCTANA